ncbi:MAG TPA: elongation factor G [Chloroflexota bacterium]|nr:elongation factor G [Chloroflexota bacterium]
MKAYSSDKIRNLALVGHGGSGKTTLAEAMLFDSGAINRLGKVDEGNTTSDHDPDEIKHHISINLSVLPLEWQDHKINLIDIPGYPDFAGEVKAGLRVSDAALVLLDAAAGVEVGTGIVWRAADEHRLPRMVVVNKMDREHADFEAAVQSVHDALDAKAVVVQLPIGQEANFKGVVNVATGKACTFDSGKVSEGNAPADMAGAIAAAKEKLMDAVCETDDDLLSKYLEGEDIPQADINMALRKAICNGQVIPILCASGGANKGVQPLLDTIVECLPSPDDAVLSAEDDKTIKEKPDRLAAFVFKTVADPFVGKLTYLRVYAGSLKGDSHAWNANKGKEERVGQLLMLRGKNNEPVGEIKAGDIGAVAKLQETTTSDTLTVKDSPVKLAPIVFPKPVYSAAIEPKTKADLDKMGNALARMAEEDPTLSIRKDSNTGDNLLSGMGESHISIAVERMQRKFGVNLDVQTPKVPYRETIKSPAKAQGKFKRQTGGHGQFGDTWIELAPAKGEGFVFEDKIVGGVVPKQYIPAVEKGIREAMQEGLLAGYPVIDVRARLYDGSYHPVDSSEMAFKIAGSMGFKAAAQQASPVLLEPIMDVTVTVPSDFMGDVIGDLNGKRARVLGMEPAGGGLTEIRAHVPMAEMLKYATDLRSITQGRGTYTMEPLGYEEVPAHMAQKVIAEAEKHKKEEAAAH